jgi:hypothetical protein
MSYGIRQNQTKTLPSDADANRNRPLATARASIVERIREMNETMSPTNFLNFLKSTPFFGQIGKREPFLLNANHPYLSVISCQYVLHLGLTVPAFEINSFHDRNKLPWRVITDFNFLVLIGEAELDLCACLSDRKRIGFAIVGRQTHSEPEAAPNFALVDRQRSETGSWLNAMPFDSVIQLLLRLVEYVPLLGFSPDISRNRTMA